MSSNALLAKGCPGESRGSSSPEKSPVFRDDQYIYALCKDCDTGEYGVAMSGLDSSRSYDDHSYFPEGWSTHGKAVANFRNMAFRMGLKLLQKNGRVVMRLPERKPFAANGKIHSRRVSDV